jgi:tetratricopeptide (TPR) repeat protein
MADLEIKGYRIVKELGRGGMATVYLAIQESVERKVALKVMLQALAADPSFSERFLREAKIVAQLSHPHIVAVYDVAISGQNHYIAMEYHEGGELKDKIKEGMAVKDILWVTKQMANALDFAHSKGYVHRDIKPENVLFKSDGNIVLSDFGIARGNDANTRMTATGSVIGTPHYMSPEQAQGHELDGRADLYSLGIVFFEMLVGTVPYKGDSALSVGIKHLRDPIPRLPAHYKMFQTFLDKLLAKEPEDRWQTGADIIQTLDTLDLQTGGVTGVATAPNAVLNAAAGNSGTVAMTQVSAEQSQAAKSGGGLKWVASILVLAGLAGGGFYYLKTRSGETMPASVAVAPATDTVTAESKSQKIRQLLAEAESTIQQQRIGEIKSKAAARDVVQKYREVLKLDPENAEALEGLRGLAGKLIALANKSIVNHKLILASKQLEIAETVDPEHPKLADSRQALQDARNATQRASEQKQAERRRLAKIRQQDQQQQKKRATAQQVQAQKLNTLLNQADELLSPYQLTPKRIAEARNTYRQAWKLAPSDARVAGGDRRVADAYLRLATDLTDQKKYKVAQNMIKEGLAVVPNHSQLKDLEAYIDKQGATKKKRRTFGGF